MARAKNASTVSVHLSNTVIAELDRRAALIGYTRSKYAAALVTRWYARRAEPVLQIETENLQPIPHPHGGFTWLGAELKPGAKLSGFADSVPAAVDESYSPTAQFGAGGGASPIESTVSAETVRRRSHSKRAKNSA